MAEVDIMVAVVNITVVDITVVDITVVGTMAVDITVGAVMPVMLIMVMLIMVMVVAGTMVVGTPAVAAGGMAAGMHMVSERVGVSDQLLAGFGSATDDSLLTSFKKKKPRCGINTGAEAVWIRLTLKSDR